MKRVIIGIGLVILILCLLSREVYYFIVIDNVYKAIEDFINESNRYYSVTRMDKIIEVLRKGNTVKYNIQKDCVNICCEWRNFSDNQEYFINFENQNFRQNMLLEIKFNSLNDLPISIMNIYRDDKFHITEFLKIKYIIPIKYNNQQCYKIKIQRKELIVDKTTYLPVYYAVKVVNSAENSSSLMENIYEFRVGGVTDEDVALPDLTGFTNIDEP